MFGIFGWLNVSTIRRIKFNKNQLVSVIVGFKQISDSRITPYRPTQKNVDNIIFPKSVRKICWDYG